MHIHIALFKWNPEVKQEEIDEVLSEIKNLKEKITGLKEIYVGENTHVKAKGFTHAAIIIAETKKALNEYRDYPDHVLVAQKINIMAEDGLGFDFND